MISGFQALELIYSPNVEDISIASEQNPNAMNFDNEKAKMQLTDLGR